MLRLSEEWRARFSALALRRPLSGLFLFTCLFLFCLEFSLEGQCPCRVACCRIRKRCRPQTHPQRAALAPPGLSPLQPNPVVLPARTRPRPPLRINIIPHSIPQMGPHGTAITSTSARCFLSTHALFFLAPCPISAAHPLSLPALCILLRGPSCLLSAISRIGVALSQRLSGQFWAHDYYYYLLLLRPLCLRYIQRALAVSVGGPESLYGGRLRDWNYCVGRARSSL